jgi:hypothetical protein
MPGDWSLTGDLAAAVPSKLGESPGTLFLPAAAAVGTWSGGVVGGSSGVLDDQHRRLVGVVVSLPDHA